ncbi:MAG: redox-regulated ATPase YchF [Phycisphaeraceae bacterium]
MEAGIVGLPNVGKSTLFNALTESQGAEAANYPFCTIEPNVGVVAVPDPRLDKITQYIPPQKVIPAALRLVDIAGIVKGASEGEGLGNKFLSHIRNVDAILHVVRCFAPGSAGTGEIAHVMGDVDPLRDIDIIDTELMLADLQTIETALPKAVRAAKSGDKDAKLRVALLEQAKALLDDGKPLRQLELSPEETKALKGFGFITAKKVLYVANVDEDDVLGETDLVNKVRERAKAEGGAVVPVCAKLESELAELEGDDKSEMLEAVGLTEPALATLARAAYALLGLQSFFTAGEQEVRAWTIPVGATAPQSAGVIHTDFEKKFIRAEVYTLDVLEAHQTEKAIRDAGKLRVEGKDYIVSDGDICHFLTGA